LIIGLWTIIRGDIGSHRKMEKYNHSVQGRKLRQVL